MSISPPWNPPVIDLTEVTSAAGNGAAVATASGGKVSSAAYPLEIDDSDDEDDHDDGGMALIIHDRESDGQSFHRIGHGCQSSIAHHAQTETEMETEAFLKNQIA